MKHFCLGPARVRFVAALITTCLLALPLSAQNLAGDLTVNGILGMVVRGYVSADLPEGARAPVFANNRGDQLVANALPANTELVRMGNSYQAITSTAATAGTAFPTTTALWTLWNGEQQGTGRAYVIDAVFWTKIIVDTTQVEAGPTMFCMNNKSLPITAITGTLTPISLSGRRNYAGRGLVGVGQAVTNDTWFPCGTTSAGIVPAIAGSGWQSAEYPINGTYIVPPGGAFSLALAEITATASKFQLGARWHEVQLKLGF